MKRELVNWNIVQRLIQNTAWGAKKIQNMQALMRDVDDCGGSEVLLKEFQRTRTWEMTEKQYLKRK